MLERRTRLKIYFEDNFVYWWKYIFRKPYTYFFRRFLLSLNHLAFLPETSSRSFHSSVIPDCPMFDILLAEKNIGKFYS